MHYYGVLYIPGVVGKTYAMAITFRLEFLLPGCYREYCSDRLKVLACDCWCQGNLCSDCVWAQHIVTDVMQ